MKYYIMLFFNMLFNLIYAQNPPIVEVVSKVNEVTVFVENAQITRKKIVEVNKGKSVLKFINLSPFIDHKSVQVKVDGAMVLSVNHQQNYLDKLKKPQNLTSLEASLETINNKIEVENAYISIIKEELAFLKDNRVIGGKNEQISVTELRETSNFYSNKLTTLKLKQIEKNKTLKKLIKQKEELVSQIKTMSSKEEFANGEIVVKIDAKTSGKLPFELTYVVKNAGWFPSYDIRAKTISDPIKLTYKANVKQDTKVNWDNVKLKFSSSDPNVSGVAPQLKTYYLGYNSFPPTYQKQINAVRGSVRDESGAPLIGVNVLVKGTSIGTSTDFDGNYSLTIPSRDVQLEYSSVGYQTKNLSITGSVMNINLQEEEQSLSEVVITGYSPRDDNSLLQGRSTGSISRNKKKTIKPQKKKYEIPTIQIERQTTVDFEIELPYTVKSDNKSYVVDMSVNSLPATYQYFSIPKISNQVFLMAHLINWEKYNLLEAEANVFFEGTFVGKTLLDVRSAKDTLNISLGIDKSVSIKREKNEDYTTRQFIGNKKEENKSWKISVKNNKKQPVNMIVLDQIPISTKQEIEIELRDMSKGKFDESSGKIEWEFKMAPNTNKALDFKYSVKYPKNKNLIIE